MQPPRAGSPSDRAAFWPKSARGRLVLVLATALLVLIPVEVVLAVEAPRPSIAPAVWFAFASRIDHIVFVVMENHPYDNLYGTYCTATGPNCPIAANGIPRGSCLPLNTTAPNGPCVRPFAFTAQNASVTTPLPHDWNSSTRAFDGGLMDGFYAAEQSGRDPFGHYNGSTAPTYWDLAEEYALSDNFYSSVLSYSLPNHWHIVAGQAPPEIVTHGTGLRGAGPGFLQVDRQYLAEANGTSSVEDLLLNSSTSWGYYDFPLPTYDHALVANQSLSGAAYAYWNPLAAKAESYTAGLAPHFHASAQFFGDAHNGTLPNIAWVIPPSQYSDHPPERVDAAQGWLASVVDSVEASPEWNSSVVFVTWDDYGGFYDHVAPPVANGAQLGFRVPLLAIGPYVREGYVTHAPTYFESILHLMEWRFRLGCLVPLDCNAPLPLDLLNFSAPRRSPIFFPTDVNLTSYPMPLQPRGAFVPAPAFEPPSRFVAFARRPDVD
ncbi:MAG TPA: alkaline phosphatase family protein [Thermoplasmata archaeon]|nr:alkaline phosphatase family protein [Thermoplasmata archaeon]